VTETRDRDREIVCEDAHERRGREKQSEGGREKGERGERGRRESGEGQSSQF